MWRLSGVRVGRRRAAGDSRGAGAVGAACVARAGRAAAVVLAAIGAMGAAPPARAQVALRGEKVYTMGPAGVISDGVVVIRDGKVAAVGPAASTPVPEGFRVLTGKVVTPGLIDGRATIGLSGIYNQRHDSDQLETSGAMQPELRALDAYNPQEELIAFVRSFGVTTLHTGHAPGELITGQTIVVKTVGRRVEDALLKSPAAIVAQLGPNAFRGGGSPGTRGKQMSLLRQELLKAQDYRRKRDAAAKGAGGAGERAADAAAPAPAPVAAPVAAPGGADKPAERSADKSAEKEKEKTPPARDLRLESLSAVLAGELPMIVTANRAQDIDSALRLAEEFKFKLVIDGGAEAVQLAEQLKAAGVPVIAHPPMMRYVGELENASFTTPAVLVGKGLRVSLQSGYEAYVPKARVVLLEAAIAAANGLSFEQALATITTEPARLLGIDGRVGSLEVGKDGDAAVYDGDPFEYVTHCIGVVINGEVVSEVKR